MSITLPQPVLAFMKTVSDAHHEIYVVGGSVRDLLLHIPTKDWDFTTSARPEQILELFPDGFYNNQFGTVGVPHVMFEGAEVVFEVTTYRTESSYNNKRHPSEVAWSTNLTDDLARRDFTINAIAYDGTTMVDPYGGQEDLNNRLIRAVGDAHVRFEEDALRLMRAVRLSAQLGFTIEESTKQALAQQAAAISHISGERIRDELLRLICTPNCAQGINYMREVGLLAHVLPELDACFGVDQVSPERHHIYDVGTHLVQSLAHCPSTDPITRLSTLLHDIGKKETMRRDPETQIITFYNHEVVGAHQARAIAKRLKLSNKDADKLYKLIRHHQFTVTEEQTDRAIKRFIRELGLEYVQDMLDLRTGDRLGSGSSETSWRTELFKKRIVAVQHTPFSVRDLKIDGHDVMSELHIAPSKQIGDIMDALFEKVENGELKNEREELLSALKAFATK